jgi:serine protease AprX
MKRILISFLFLISVLNVIAQDRYVVFLKDKANTPYQLNNPSAFLSQRAIERRIKMGIVIDSLDIPVNASYVSGIAGTGAKVLNRSRWFNSMIVQADTNQIIAVGALNYVEGYVKVFGANLQRVAVKPKYEEAKAMDASNERKIALGGYGGATNQNQMLNADLLHNAGYTGKQTVIAVIDAGFTNTDEHRAFDSIRLQNRILGTWDFSRNDAYVYDFSGHGTSVLSCIAANVPDTMIGTAPHAKFYLLRSEEEATEYEVEEYNWAAAAEYADSVGADIINSSLGYTEFDARSQNHTYADMNGNTAVVTLAAKMASNKGVLVVNSAGNSGNDTWFHIGAPADAEEVFSIGAVQSDRSIAGFSSRGPTSDQRIKPDVSAQGAPAYVARTSGGFGTGSGTSFSGPIIAGFTACAMELYKISHPNAKPAEIKAWIKKYSDRANQPDNEYGYGIPDGSKLLLNASIDTNPNKSFKLYPNPNTGTLYIDVNNGNNQQWNLQVLDIMGKILYSQPFSTIELLMGIELPANISRGFYIISLSTEKDSFKQVFIRE